MKTNQTVPLAVSLAPVIAAAPPLIIGVAVIAGLAWLFSKEKSTPNDETPDSDSDDVPTVSAAPIRPVASAGGPIRRITREDIAEALEYGVRPVPRGTAVATLVSRGFKKTAAYKSLSPDGRFGEILECTQDGLVEWKG